MKSHLDEILKQFDENFSNGKKGGQWNGYWEDIDMFISTVKIENVKSFLRTSLISLLEKYGEDVIGATEDVSGWYGTSFANDGLGDKGTRNELRLSQRTKLKEILSNLK